MKKYKCTNMECNYSCELRTYVFPHKCVNWDYIPTWVEMDGTEPSTNCNQLPKLTAEVFDREDCPEWANWAAVDSCGDAYYYNEKPQTNSRTWGNPVLCEFDYIDKFDATDWQNSLIERHAKLPDWCKVGEWVWDIHTKEYVKVTSVDDNEVSFNGGFYGAVTPGSFAVEYKQARLRPYRAEEMKALVGKVIYTSEAKAFMVISYAGGEVLFGKFLHTAEDLALDIYKFPDGKPCGVLEHLEDGEEPASSRQTPPKSLHSRDLELQPDMSCFRPHRC